jgi:regulator of replication initiation timing
MSDQSALLERMSTAVRTAYKAMEVLKEENSKLKNENELLKLEVLALRRESADTGEELAPKPTLSLKGQTTKSVATIPVKDVT